MKEQITAKIYANSFLDIASENNIDLAEELTKFTEVINSSNDLEAVLFLEVFTDEEKLNVLNDIMAKLASPKLVHQMIAYLINEKRIGLFPLVFKEVIVTDDERKGFLRGTIYGSGDNISDAEKNQLITEVKKALGKEAQLGYEKNEKISAGYRVMVEDLQLDATIDNQLNRFKESVIGK